jgi:hypothetical protein
VTDLSPVFVVLAIGGAVGLFAKLADWLRAERQQDSLWAEAARRLRGTFTQGLSEESMSIGAVVDGVEVLITPYKGGKGSSWTRVWARADAPWGFTLHVGHRLLPRRAEKTFLSKLGEKLGMQDIVVGHREFDELFVVKSSDEEYARVWLEPRTASLLCALPSWSHELESDQLISTCGSFVEDPDELSKAARATASLARRGTALREQWTRLAQDLGGVLEGEPWKEEPSIALGPPSPVFVELTQAPLANDSHHRVTRVRAPCAPNAPAPRVDEEQRRALDALAASSVVITETQVAILFAGVMLDAERLTAATALARQLVAGEGAGPYR